MNKISKVFMLMLFVVSGINAQSLNNSNGGFPKKEKIDGKNYRIVYYEHSIDKSPEEVWNEVAKNFINVDQVATAITESHGESGDKTEGIGAKRFCAIDFGKRKVTVKEEVVEYEETDARKIFTYEVYESKGFPARVYNTWIVRVGEDGKTYLGTAFKMRAKFPFPTGMMVKQLLKAGGVKNGVLAYKHFLEKGEGNVATDKLAVLYPEES